MIIIDKVKFRKNDIIKFSQNKRSKVMKKKVREIAKDSGATVVGVQEEVLEGNMFVFIKAADNAPVTVDFWEDGRKKKTAKALTKPTIISKFSKEFSIREKSFRGFLGGSNSRMPSLELVSLVTDRRIYKPGDTVHVALVGLLKPQSVVEMAVACNGNVVFSDSNVTLNGDGTAVLNMKNIMDEGEYLVEAKIGDSVLSCNFVVAEYEMTTLTLLVLKQMTEESKLKVYCKLLKLGEAYEGDVKAILKCDVCGRDVNIVNVNTNKDGNFVAEYTLSGLSPCCMGGPYRVEVNTSDGDTASTFLQNTRKSERVGVTISHLGDEYKAALNDQSNATKVRGINIWKDKSVNSLFSIIGQPVATQSNGHKAIQLRVNSSVKLFEALAYNPVNRKINTYSLQDLDKGDEVTLAIHDTEAPILAFHVGAFVKEKDETLTPFESSMIAFVECDDNLTVEVPDEAKPGELVAIKLTSKKKSTCLVAVADARMEREDIEKNIASAIFKSLGSMLYPTKKGKEIEEIKDTKFYTKSTSFGMPMVRSTFPRNFGVHLNMRGSTPISSRTDLYSARTLSAKSIDMGSVPVGGVLPAYDNDDFTLSASMNDNITMSYMISVSDTNSQVEPVYAFAAMDSMPMAMAAAASAEGIALMTENAIATRPSPVQLRTEFPEMLMFELMEVEGEKTVQIKLGDQVGVWKVYVYMFSGIDLIKHESSINATKDIAIDVDVPTFIGEGDKVMCKVDFNTKSPVQLSVMCNDEVISDIRAAGVGNAYIELDKPGMVGVAVQGFDEQDAVMKTVGRPAVAIIPTSKIMIPQKGDKIKKDEKTKRIVVYPKPVNVERDMITGLLQYPHGCGEQTSAKLKGLMHARQSIFSGSVDSTNRDSELKEVDDMIVQGLNRMYNNFFDRNTGMAGIWGTHGDTYSTAKIAKNMLPFYSAVQKYAKNGDNGASQIISLAMPMLDGMARYLRSNNVQDTELTPIMPEVFKDYYSKNGLKSVEDAVSAYFTKDYDVDKIMDFLKSKMQVNKDGSVSFEPSRQSWCGKVEVTCKAAKVLFHEDPSLFMKSFNYITSFIQNGRLYSTSDTCAFLDLVSEMGGGTSKKAIVDGKEIEIKVATECNDEVEIIEEGVLVRMDYDREIDYREMDSNFEFAVFAPGQLKVGERTTIKITPRENTLCPLAKVYLPANLAFVKGGVNVQSSIFPIKGESLEMDVVAIRRGVAGMYVVLTDMYDVDKIGVSDRLEVTVH